MALISAQNIGLRVEGDEGTIRDIVDSLREVYNEGGRDMPKHLNDIVYSFEEQLGIIEMGGE